MFLKSDIGINPTGGRRWETAILFKPFNGWCALVKGGPIFPHAGNGRQVYLRGVPNVKVDGSMLRRGKSFSILDAFAMGVEVCPIDISPSATLKNTAEPV